MCKGVNPVWWDTTLSLRVTIVTGLLNLDPKEEFPKTNLSVKQQKLITVLSTYRAAYDTRHSPV